MLVPFVSLHDVELWLLFLLSAATWTRICFVFSNVNYNLKGRKISGDCYTETPACLLLEAVLPWVCCLVSGGVSVCWGWEGLGK